MIRVVAVVEVDYEELISTCEVAVRTVAGLLREVKDPTAPAIGHWAIGDVACHMAHTFDRNAAGARGEGFPGELIHDISGYNQAYLDTHDERDPKVLAGEIESYATEFFAALRKRDPDDLIPWFEDVPIPVYALPGVMIGECWLHGFDIAKAEGKSWRIPTRDANLTFDTSLPMVPLFANEAAIADVDLCFDVKMRGGSRVHFVVAGGKIAVESPNDRRVDCHISARPDKFLLVSYNRIGQWAPVFKGQIVTWGRKPLAALKLPSYLEAP